MTDIQRNVKLAQYTSLGLGGVADQLVVVSSTLELISVLESTDVSVPVTVLGYGCNVLVSDDGIRGLTIITRGGDLALGDDKLTITADAGVWWDDFVLFAINHGLWGVELMSGVPGSIGAAVAGNISCYGQAVSDTFKSIRVYDRSNKKIKIMSASELGLGYRTSCFQEPSSTGLVVLDATFVLSSERTTEIKYQVLLDYALEHNMAYDTLSESRELILVTRREGASLYDYTDPEHQIHSAGSFFKNPTVTIAQADMIMGFEEKPRTKEQLRTMNTIHGGVSTRISAAQVLLAAGYVRGQTWGSVRLHQSHILKIENTGDATANDVANVAREIQQTVKVKLDIDLFAEVKMLGNFQP